MPLLCNTFFPTSQAEALTAHRYQKHFFLWLERLSAPHSLSPSSLYWGHLILPSSSTRENLFATFPLKVRVLRHGFTLHNKLHAITHTAATISALPESNACHNFTSRFRLQPTTRKFFTLTSVSVRHIQNLLWIQLRHDIHHTLSPVLSFVGSVMTSRLIRGAHL